MAQVFDGLGQSRGRLDPFSELRQHGNTSRANVLSRGVEQCAVIGERDIVEILVVVVGVEGAPAAIAALHADDPFAGTRNGILISPPIPEPVGTIHRHNHNRGIVDIRVIGVVVLEGPSARPQARSRLGPIAFQIEDLARLEPSQAAHRPIDSRASAGFQQRVTHQPGIPDR